jgi:glycosyltransferase involved in cell wall biosynthesis
LDSILPQLCKEIHLQIIDDASVDNTYNIIIEMTKPFYEYVKIKRLRENQGLSKNLNWYLANGQSEYVFRMDADDTAAPNRFHFQLEYALEHPEIDIIGGQALRVNSLGKAINITQKPLHHEDIINKLYTNPFVHSTLLYKREAILNAGNYSTSHRHGQDYELWFRCAKYGLIMFNLPDVLVDYTISPTSKYNISTYWNELIIGIQGSIIVKHKHWVFVALVSRFLFYCLKIIVFKLNSTIELLGNKPEYP